MFKKIFFTIGTLAFVLGLVLWQTLNHQTRQSQSRDDSQTRYGVIGDDVPPFCTWEVSLSDRVLSENKSQAVVINLHNKSERDCESNISLRAPGFDISPPKEEQKITIPPKNSGSLSWIIIPRKTGSYDLIVADVLNTKIIGITVTNLFGLSPTQAKAFSILGSLFGPMFTVPWWWDRWQRKSKPRTSEPSEPVKMS